jgi:hypothetical protein
MFILTLGSCQAILPRPNQGGASGFPPEPAVIVVADLAPLIEPAPAQPPLRRAAGRVSGRSRQYEQTSGMRLAAAFARHDSTPQDPQPIV